MCINDPSAWLTADARSWCSRPASARARGPSEKYCVARHAMLVSGFKLIHRHLQLTACRPHTLRAAQWYSYINFMRYAWTCLMRNQVRCKQQHGLPAAATAVAYQLAWQAKKPLLLNRRGATTSCRSFSPLTCCAALLLLLQFDAWPAPGGNPVFIGGECSWLLRRLAVTVS